MIVGVAVRFTDGTEVRLPRPNRHVDCFELAFSQGLTIKQHKGSENQGFYTDMGKYVDRIQAMTHVRACGQEILPQPLDGHVNSSPVLCSEDVW